MCRSDAVFLLRRKRRQQCLPIFMIIAEQVQLLKFESSNELSLHLYRLFCRLQVTFTHLPLQP